ncbi:MAG TPA: hypothetical protein VMK42_20715 [Anaeromyxobacteraceae bacterium]|nr:hypothetical protein [Anaeromyxobacteraceae bacterium]
MSPVQDRLATAWWALRIGLGLGVFAAGLDKFFNLLTTWTMYVSPLAERFLPVSDATFMRVVGAVEMLLGIATLTRWTRQGAYVTAIWLLAIAVNLASTGNFWDLAVRDLEIAVSAFALGRLSEWRASLARAPVESGAPLRRGGAGVESHAPTPAGL